VLELGGEILVDEEDFHGRAPTESTSRRISCREKSKRCGFEINYGAISRDGKVIYDIKKSIGS
jgi:hypothetical protein